MIILTTMTSQAEPGFTEYVMYEISVNELLLLCNIFFMLVSISPFRADAIVLSNTAQTQQLPVGSAMYDLMSIPGEHCYFRPSCLFHHRYIIL
jgi:hypothetical protein